jgi:hypothetical protein
MSATKQPSLPMIGRRFGKLIVISFSHYHGTRQMYFVRCDCGRTNLSNGTDLRGGKINSCGCGVIGRGFRHGGRKSSEYQSWCAMKARCENPKTSNFASYGGRGISVCERWKHFPCFLADMGSRPIGLSLDRINNNGNYEPSNCRWATSSQQSSNTRVNVFITNHGETHTAQEWARITGIDISTICKRVKAGWSEDDILREPTHVRRG